MSQINDSNNENLIRIIRELSSPLDPLPTDQLPTTTSIDDIQHIVFDVYGTLFVSGVGDIGNSAPADRGAALSTTLSKMGARHLPENDVLEKVYLEEIQNNQGLSRILGARNPEVEIREVWQRLITRTAPNLRLSPDRIEEMALRFELAVNPVWPMPDLGHILDQLSIRFPPFGIVSNAQFFTPLLFPALTGRSLRDLHFDPFSCVWSFEEREAKPSTKLFEILLSRVEGDLRPEQILYVGNDRLNDIYAAREAGLRTALFAGDSRSLRLREDHPDCKDAIPDCTITNLSQLFALIR